MTLSVGGVPYYYNPCTMDQEWTTPHGTIMCMRCRETFCERRCNTTRKYLCVACFDLEHVKLDDDEKAGLRWKQINGAKRTAFEVEVEKLVDMPLNAGPKITRAGRKPKVNKLKAAAAKMSAMKALGLAGAKQKAKRDRATELAKPDMLVGLLVFKLLLVRLLVFKLLLVRLLLVRLEV